MATPETIIVDRDFSVTWSQLGVLTDKALRDAKSTLEKLSTR
jgi:hypothetical protein